MKIIQLLNLFKMKIKGLKEVLNSADLFENVECDIDGEIKLMNEYRILVEPNSKENEQLYSLLFENNIW